ncbi:protein zyg-11 homolog B-like [Coccinella septempunctata]|uniref:protein zyg-11 homolog B-like n=1 Tax=Coccinella septempunctata TaxID=41139 RepID=UPI001D06A317|nr:protein zyg-11 homolog B-like [Coccinella septempunctata]
MKRSPNPLEEICLDKISDNIRMYINFLHMPDTQRSEASKCQCVFKDPNIFLIQRMSEKLMSKLHEKRFLTNSTLSLFSEQNTKLKRVKLEDITVDKEGMMFLKNHKITDLECINIKTISIVDIIDCLDSWSVQNLISANFTKCSFMDSFNYCYMVKILAFKNLRSLSLAYTELNQFCFKRICTDLKLLERLDLSGTYITCLEPLRNLQHQLKYLSLADLPHVNNLVPVVRDTYKLKHLDVSLFNKKLDELNIEAGQSQVAQLLEFKDDMPGLVSLDISGWKDHISKDLLYNFMLTHPKLEYLGIVFSDLMFEPAFCETQYFQYPRHVVIGGLGNKDQIAVTLQRYKNRASYIQKALYHLFQITNRASPEPCPEMFELVLPVMAHHPLVFGVQMAATACLYNLTKGELSKNIHPNLLSKGINLTLNAMTNFPKEYQLQKNSLLTLYNDRILLEVNFDRSKCAVLVLDALCKFSDDNVSRMAAAICSILASKITSKETSQLGSKVKYMSKLLEMVANRVKNEMSDITLKFTLSALWNLTDDSPDWCTVFVIKKGVLLFLKVLEKFKNDSTIEPKVLGLLNNIAEVTELRKYLMLDELMEQLYFLLKSENIDVSYFAAGIVANLASDGEEPWIATSHGREEMLAEMEDAIIQWEVPQSEMVAYRSFKPFIPLLAVNMDYRVQLWALWAIHHVCTKIPKRYCSMLKEEGGDVLLSILLKKPDVHEVIRVIAGKIMDTLENTQII